MAKKSSSLTTIGKILVLLDGIFIIVRAVFELLGNTLDLGFNPGAGVGAGFVDGVIGAIVAIVIGLIFVFLFTGKIDLDGLILAIVVLVLSVLFGSWLSLLGGILILIDALT